MELLYSLSRKFTLFISFLFLASQLSAQTQIWYEQFGTGCDQAVYADTITTSNGLWSTTDNSTGSTANIWYISATENGNSEGSCGTGCGTDRTAHIGNDPNSSVGPFICPTGDCGAAYDASASSEVTDRRLESPTINCSGYTGISLEFLYIMEGETGSDYMEVYYFDGTSWTSMGIPAKTNNASCSGQGLWTKHTVALPASADNNSNVQVGFRWQNDGNGAGSDPSVAIDSIAVTGTVSGGTPPTAAFSVNDSTICDSTCVTFTDLSSNSPTSWQWYFPGGVVTVPGADTTQNPQVCYPTPGNYDVSLVVSNSSGSDSLTMTNFMQVDTCTSGGALNADFSSTDTTFCQGLCIDYSDLTTGGTPTTWQWSFPGGTPNSSTAQNPTNICYNTSGFYDVTLLVSDGSSTDTITRTNFITVNNCPPPTANFSSSDSTVCEGGCINFNDLSTDASSWQWSFPGATPNSSTAQNPTNICYNTQGTYDVKLVVTNGSGADSITMTNFIQVDTCPTPTASFSASDTTFCEGNCINYNDLSSNAGTYTWTFPGGSPGSYTGANPPTICYTTPGTYTTKLVVSNSQGSDSTTLNITVDACPQPVANFTALDTTICAGETVIFMDQSSGSPTSWNWQFPGGNPPSDTVQNPTVTYPSPGTYDVTLIVSNSFGSDSLTYTGYIEVVGCSPEAAMTVSNNSPCAGRDSVYFTDISSGGPTSWSWQFPGGTPNTSNKQNPAVMYYFPGTFDVYQKVSNQYGSDDTTYIDEITVGTCGNPDSDSYFEEEGDTLCHGSCIDYFYRGENATNWMWIFEGGTPDTLSGDTSNYDNIDPTVCYTDSTADSNLTVMLITWSASDSSDADTSTRSFFLRPIYPVDAGKDTTIALGMTAILDASGPSDGQYIWEPRNPVNCYYCKSTTASPDSTTLFEVEYTNDSTECVQSDTIRVIVDVVYEAGVPSAFSPNGDGNNDVLYIRGGTINSVTFAVFNRYGQKVFETTDQNIGWDGTHKGKDVNPGVFAYYAKVTFIDGSETLLKGNVTLIR